MPKASKSLDKEPLTNGNGLVIKADEKKKTIDDIILLGRYCYLILLFSELMAFTCLASMTLMTYAGFNPVVIGCGNEVFSNETSICDQLPQRREETGCQPILEYPFRSVQVEWDYLCKRSKKVKNTISVQMIGVLIGAAFFGQLSDMHGRRLTLLISGLGNTLTLILTAFSWDLTSFTIFRTITGFFTGGLTVVHSVFLVESIPRKHRMWICNAFTWSPNFIVFPIVAYFFQSWDTLSLAIAVASGSATLLVFLLCETPRWYMQKGRFADARDVFERIRRIDGVNTRQYIKETEELICLEQSAQALRSSKVKRYTFIHLFCTYKMISWTVTLLFGMCTAALITYALLFNMEQLSGSLYLNSIIIGIARWSINIGVAIIDYKVPSFGRKIINIIAVGFSIVALSAMALIYFIGIKGGTVISIGTVITMAMTSQLFTSPYMVANELYPTAVRNLAISAMSTASRVGSIMAPQLFYLADFFPSLPYIVLTIICVIDIVSFEIFIPETKNRKLEDHLPPKEQRLFYKVPTKMKLAESYSLTAAHPLSIEQVVEQAI